MSRHILISGVLGVVGLAGCAQVSDGAASMQARFATAPPSVRVGSTQVLDARVNPSAGVQVAADGDAVVVRFAHPGRPGTVKRLNPTSLETMAEATAPIAGPSQESSASWTRRVDLDGGHRFVVCWKAGSSERGYRVMAQAFNASDGSPRGAAVPISPSDVDVVGAVGAVTFDGRRVVATFAASAGGSFSAYAVPIETL